MNSRLAEALDDVEASLTEGEDDAENRHCEVMGKLDKIELLLTGLSKAVGNHLPQLIESRIHTLAELDRLGRIVGELEQDAMTNGHG